MTRAAAVLSMGREVGKHSLRALTCRHAQAKTCRQVAADSRRRD